MHLITIRIPSDTNAASIQQALEAFKKALNLPQLPQLKSAPQPPQHRTLRNSNPRARPHGKFGNVHNIINFTPTPREAG